MKNIKPTPTGEAQEVKIKVRINSNGVIQLTSANVVDKKPKEEVPVDNGNAETNNMDVSQEVSTVPLHSFLSSSLFPSVAFPSFRILFLPMFCYCFPLTHSNVHSSNWMRKSITNFRLVFIISSLFLKMVFYWLSHGFLFIICCVKCIRRFSSQTIRRQE